MRNILTTFVIILIATSTIVAQHGFTIEYAGGGALHTIDLATANKTFVGNSQNSFGAGDFGPNEILYAINSVSNEFYESEEYNYDSNSGKWKTKFNPENYKAKNFSEEVVDAKNGKVVIKLGDKINYLNAKKLSNDGLKDILVSNDYLYVVYFNKFDVSIGPSIIWRKIRRKPCQQERR